MDNIISNCPLCEEHSLHLIPGSGDEIQLMQCIWCGYVSSGKFNGTKKENKEYQKLTDDMKGWSKEALNRIWIPSMFTLPDGMIYPENEDGEMKWKLAEMVDIPETERNNYPDEHGGQYNQRYDTDNQKIFDIFLEAMSEMNEKAKQNSISESKIKLPKLKRMDG